MNQSLQKFEQLGCAIDECESKHYGRGYCQKHYLRWWKHGDPLLSKNPTRGIPVAERFFKQVDVSGGLDACWIWTGTTLKSGYPYGRFTVNGRKVNAHRFSYQLATGIEPTLHILHSCDNPRCVNPKHLRQGTHAENMHDKVLRNRSKTNDSTRN